MSSQPRRARPARNARLFRALVCVISGWLSLSGCGDSPDAPDPVEDAPPDPVTLNLTGAGPLADTLEWSPSGASDFASYRLLRLDAPESSPPDRAAARVLREIPLASQTTAIDSTVSPGAEYAYWIEVVDQAGQVGLSDPLLISTPRLPFFGIGLSPREVRLAPGETLDLTLWVESAPPLFGIALDLRLPESLELLACTSGEFFGDEHLSLCQPQAGGVGLSWTRLRGSGPVAGFGVLGRLRVRVTDPGGHAIDLSRAPEVADETGAPIAPPPFWGSVIAADSFFAAPSDAAAPANAAARSEQR